MKGDQSIEMADADRELSYALGYHFGEDCCGTLDFVAYFNNEDDDALAVTRCQFVCKKCNRIIEIVT